MDTRANTPVLKRQFNLIQLLILPYYFFKEMIRNIQKKQFFKAIGLFIVAVILAGFWLCGYTVTAVAGYQIAKQVVSDQQNKKSPVATSATSNNFIADYKLFGMVNDYRSSQKLSAVSQDEETCKVAQKRLDNYFWQANLDINNYRDLCPSCNSIAVAEAKDTYDLNSILNLWKDNKDTLNTLKTKYKNGCVKAKEGKVSLVMVDKNISNPQKTITTSNDPIIDCKSTHPNCYGSSIRVAQSQCSQITCCQISDNSWSVFASVEKCKEGQEAYLSNNKYNPTNYVLPTYVPSQTVVATSPPIDYSAQNQQNINLRSQCLSDATKYCQDQTTIINSRHDLGLSSKANLLNSLQLQCNQMQSDCRSKYPVY